MIGAWFDYTRTRVQDFASQITLVTSHQAIIKYTSRRRYREGSNLRIDRSTNKLLKRNVLCILVFKIPAQRQFKNGDAYRISSTRTVQMRNSRSFEIYYR